MNLMNQSWAPEGACRRLVDRGLRAAVGVRESILADPQTWSQDRGTGVTAARKAMTEVAMFASNLIAFPEYDVAGTELLASLAALEDEVEQVLELARGNPEQTVTHGLLVLILSAHGVLRPDTAREVAQLAAHTRPCFPERVPFRVLEDLWVRERYLGEDTRALRLQTLPLCSIANDVADLSISDRSRSYGLTHAAMYLCDIGLGAAEIEARALPRWDDRLRAGIGASCAGQDLDLLAEWVLADIGLSSRASRLALAGLRTLDATADLLDSLPSPSFSAADFQAMDDPARSSYRVQHSYHTEVVAAMAALAALRWGWSEPEATSPSEPWAIPVPLDVLAREVHDNTLWTLLLPWLDDASATQVFVHGELLHAWRAEQSDVVNLLLTYAAHFGIRSRLIDDVHGRMTTEPCRRLVAPAGHGAA